MGTETSISASWESWDALAVRRSVLAQPRRAWCICRGTWKGDASFDGDVEKFDESQDKIHGRLRAQHTNDFFDFGYLIALLFVGLALCVGVIEDVLMGLEQIAR
jgi:hypothetical protein